MTVSAKAANHVRRGATSAIPLLLVGIVLLMVVPLPPFLMDLMLSGSITLAVSLLLVSIYIDKPLDLSSFPTILLFSTLLRLALNVASTRLILLRGADGTEAAGRIIEAFGQFLVGGNVVVGAAIFLLLVLINFVVITKGAGRVAEVSARFTLDAMPGKQMAIDADLAAGVITQQRAVERRRRVEQEADFFGAMDGASKFVRGDAIAGLIMTGINIVVGFIVGVAQQGMSASEAASTYTVLTVGDGLASQIPALLVSTAAGVVVTRAAIGAPLAPVLAQQLGQQRKALTTAAGVLLAVGLVPGVPLLPFLFFGGVLGLAARAAPERPATDEGNEAAGTPDESEDPDRHERDELQHLLQVPLLELQVGLDLVPLLDGPGELVERVGAIRKALASEMGFIVPSVHIRDNLTMPSASYRLMLSGNEVGRGEVRVGRYLAMDPTGSLPPIAGEEVREPAFGLPARWIRASKREEAETLGYTVVDAVTVIATHLTELLRRIAPELIGRSRTQELLDLFAQQEPRLVDELVPNLLGLGEISRVLANLLAEQVSIRDLRSILEALADHARDTKDPEELTERVRRRLARHITARFKDEQGQVHALVLDPQAEERFREGSLDAAAAQRLLASLDQQAHAFAGLSSPPLLVCSPDVRRAVSDFLGRRIPGLAVVSFAEIEPSASVRTLGVVSG